jgi:hypothetical protein
VPKAFWFFPFTFLALAGALEAQQLGIPVRGFLAAGGVKVAGATVRLAAAPTPEQRFEMAFGHVELAEVARTRSGGDGYFELAAPETGFYQLQVEAEGYLGADRWISALTASPDPVQVELIRSRRMVLTVLDPEGRPVAGVRSRLGFEREGAGRYPTWPLFRTTGEDGSLAMLVPEGQDAAVALAAPGFAVAMLRLPDGRAAIEARLERGRELTVEVADPRRRFLPGVAIFAPDALLEIGRTGRDGRAVLRVAEGQQRLGFSDAEGRYAIEAVPAALPAANPAPPAADPAAAAAAPPAERLLRIVLEDRPPIEGQVFELPYRVPLAGAWVALGGLPPVFAKSDRLGFFRLPRLPGRRHLLAAKEGFRSAHADVGALPVSIGMALEPAATVYGNLTDAGGTPVPAAWVTATTEAQVRSLRSGGRSRALTDRQGRYRIADLPAGESAEIEATSGQLATKVTIEPIPAGDSLRADLRLPPRVAWRCQVLDPQDQPVAGAELFAASPRLGARNLPLLDALRLARSGQAARLGATDGEGRLKTTELAAGTYDIAVRAAAFAPVWLRGVEVGRAAGGEPLDDGGGDPNAPVDETIVLEPLVAAFGRVLDENDSGLADAGVHVAFIDDSGAISRVGPESPPIAISDERGDFSFKAVAAGQRFNLVAGKDGYVSTQLNDLVLKEGGRPGEPFELRLARAGGIEGKVSSEGRPVASATLQVEPLDPPPRPGDMAWRTHVRADPEGAFAIGRLWPGRYRLEAEANGFQPWQSEIFEVAAGELKRLEVELLPAALVVGKVLLPSGEPVADAWLSLADNSTDRPYATALGGTDVLGQYRIENAKPGAGWMQVGSNRYRRQGRAVEVGPGVNEIDFVLETGSLELAGRVVDDDGQPVAGARVRLFGDGISREERSGSDGAVRFEQLDEGKYSIMTSAAGYLGGAVQLELTESMQDESWRMRTARSQIYGSVFGVDPGSVAAVRITVKHFAGDEGDVPVASLQGSGAAVAPDRQGRYVLDNLAAGKWLLIASLPNPQRVIKHVVEIGEGEEEKQQDLEFGSLDGPWVGILLSRGQPLAGHSFALLHPELGILLQSRVNGNRLELHAAAGRYQLLLSSSGPGPESKSLDIEIGAPSEQVIDLARPDS